MQKKEKSVSNAFQAAILLLFAFQVLGLCSTCMQYMQRPEEGIRDPGTGVRVVYKLSCGFWETKLASVLVPMWCMTYVCIQVGVCTGAYGHMCVHLCVETTG